MRSTLGETVGLLGAHLHLFTLISLTVWFPTHVFLNYLEFFGEAEPIRALRVGLMVQVALDPLVVSASIMALARIKQGLPLDFWSVLSDGARAWSRLFLLRLAIITVVVLPAAAAAFMRPGAGGALAGVGVLLLVAATVAFLLRFAVADSVVVLEGRTVFTCWSRAAELTAGQRGQILATAAMLFAVVSSVAILAMLTFRASPALNHFVVRVLFDCALSVSQTLFTIALFLFYWRAAQAAVPR